VRTLRKKLAAHASAIATVTGVGYRLNLETWYYVTNFTIIN
jgi:DNA-binding response OmpR family regulator